MNASHEREVTGKLYRSMGCEVFVLSAKTKVLQTAGLPDRFVFCERKGLVWAHEFKTEGEKQREGQKLFQRLWEAAGLVYLKGGYDVAYTHLVEEGIVK